MKKLFFITLILGCISFAQEVGVKVDKVDASNEEGTTISITKGTKNKNGENKKKYVISEGSEEITGDKDVVKKGSEKNWQRACKEWRSEFKELNKDNKIISMNCGKMSCTKEGVETTCESIAKYKVRVVAEE